MPPHFAQRTTETRSFLATEVMERAFALERPAAALPKLR